MGTIGEDCKKEQINAMVRIALAMYCGEKCYCGHVFTSVDELIAEDVVFTGYRGDGRIAHPECYQKEKQKNVNQ